MRPDTGGSWASWEGVHSSSTGNGQAKPISEMPGNSDQFSTDGSFEAFAYKDLQY
jgi:hypothetical protein